MLIGLVATPVFGEGEEQPPAVRPAANDRPLCALRGPQPLSDAPLPSRCQSLTGVPTGTSARSFVNPSIDWRGDLKRALAIFDALHSEWKANPAVATVDFIASVEDTVTPVQLNDWPARFEVVYLQIYLAAYKSGRVTVLDYAIAIENEYLRGVLFESPLQVSHGLQAREFLGQIATPPPATPRTDPSRNTGRL